MSSAVVFGALAAPLAFVAASVASTSWRSDRPGLAERAGRIASWVGVVVAGAAAALVAIGGTASSPLVGAGGLGFALRLDALSVIMLLMISVLALVIVRFSASYLDGDPRHGVFLGRLAATVAAVEVLVLAGNLATFLAAWVLTSLALHQLLLFYRDRPRAVVAARKKFIVARLGDAALLGAAAVLYRHFGTGDFGEIFTQAAATAPDGWAFGPVELAAVLLVVAAALKSAQFPTHGWLVEVMETPTPVSALLHAGILNAGPFLAIRMSPVLDGARPATTLLILVGGTTAVFASVALLTQTSVKVVLGYSSVAHMGFMLMVCGLGAYPAALLHLVAHSFYKAHAFLSSGSAIDEARAAKVHLPRRLGRPARVVASAAVALVVYGAVAAAWGVDLREPVLVALGAVLVLGTTQLLAPALDSEAGLGTAVRTVALAAGVTMAFFSLEAGAHHLVAGVLPTPVGRDAVQFGLVGALLLVSAAVVAMQILEPARPSGQGRRAIAVHLRNGLYVNAAFDRVVGALRRPATVPAPVPVRAGR